MVMSGVLFDERSCREFEKRERLQVVDVVVEDVTTAVSCSNNSNNFSERESEQKVAIFFKFCL